jgi:hypothetical protein
MYVMCIYMCLYTVIIYKIRNVCLSVLSWYNVLAKFGENRVIGSDVEIGTPCIHTSTFVTSKAWLCLFIKESEVAADSSRIVTIISVTQNVCSCKMTLQCSDKMMMRGFVEPLTEWPWRIYPFCCSAVAHCLCIMFRD